MASPRFVRHNAQTHTRTHRKKKGSQSFDWNPCSLMAGPMGLEPTASGVTGRRSAPGPGTRTASCRRYPRRRGRTAERTVRPGGAGGSSSTRRPRMEGVSCVVRKPGWNVPQARRLYGRNLQPATRPRMDTEPKVTRSLKKVTGSPGSMAPSTDKSGR